MVNSSGIRVRVFDLNKGLVEYDNVKYIRITSQDYNLLIMEDYLSIIGEIEGSVDISYRDIRAFYMNSKNVFNLMIKEG